jgi:hypothetical protein
LTAVTAGRLVGSCAGAFSAYGAFFNRWARLCQQIRENAEKRAETILGYSNFNIMGAKYENENELKQIVLLNYSL